MVKHGKKYENFRKSYKFVTFCKKQNLKKFPVFYEIVRIFEFLKFEKNFYFIPKLLKCEFVRIRFSGKIDWNGTPL
jgi:hypothetical protein